MIQLELNTVNLLLVGCCAANQEPAYLLTQFLTMTTTHKFPSLQAVEQVDAEGRLGDGQRVALGNDLAHQVLFHQVGLLHDLDGQLAAGLVAPVAQEHFTEGAPADWFEDFEVFDFGRQAAGSRTCGMEETLETILSIHEVYLIMFIAKLLGRKSMN